PPPPAGPPPPAPPATRGRVGRRCPRACRRGRTRSPARPGPPLRSSSPHSGGPWARPPREELKRRPRLAGRSGPGLHLRPIAADPIDLGPHDQPLLPGLAERILVDTQEALGQLVDVLVCPGLGHAGLSLEQHV